MRPALGGMNVIGIGENDFVDRVGPLQRDFDVDAVAHALEENHGVQRFVALAQRGDEFGDSALVVKLFGLVDSLVAQPDPQARVEVRHLAQVARDNFVLELDLGKDLRVGREGGLGALAVGLAALLDLGLRNPALVALEVNFAVLVNFDFELVTERVDDRRAHAMQSAGDFVRALLELAAGVKNGVHDFECRALFSGMHIDRNSAAVVLDRNPIVAQNHDVDFRAVTGQRFVDRVVHDLIDEMMQPALGGVADVHAGPFANRFETFEYLDGLGAIAVGRLFICHRKERAMDYLSASPPPAKIVFVCGRKVKKYGAVQSDNQTLFESAACG